MRIIRRVQTAAHPAEPAEKDACPAPFVVRLDNIATLVQGTDITDYDSINETLSYD